jgi:DNA-binding MarR family transcriptional regulator
MRRRRGDLPPALQAAGGLGERHIGALVSLAVAGPATVSELADRMDMSIAHASLVVGELAGAGLVERDHDERDRRRIIVSLSDAAMPAVAQMRDRHAAPLGRFLAGLDEAEADRFIDHLSDLIECLRDDGEVDRRIGEVDPRAGEVDPRAGEVDRRAGKVDRRAGKVDRSAGE